MSINLFEESPRRRVRGHSSVLLSASLLCSSCPPLHFLAETQSTPADRRTTLHDITPSTCVMRVRLPYGVSLAVSIHLSIIPVGLDAIHLSNRAPSCTTLIAALKRPSRRLRTLPTRLPPTRNRSQAPTHPRRAGRLASTTLKPKQIPVLGLTSIFASPDDATNRKRPRPLGRGTRILGTRVACPVPGTYFGGGKPNGARPRRPGCAGGAGTAVPESFFQY
ncbi:hypothetical protein C8F04DRAFT_1303345 [Mycena alexandri]|uniref:Uncharacterized protein n=1 Tax=Mycena alexandri TaxID=1745969 RepID=A0AAD6WST5_9AGAR|nr:hypothetical protein C8F04DRAFT_1303345 [Mycena alexandri]